MKYGANGAAGMERGEISFARREIWWEGYKVIYVVGMKSYVGIFFGRLVFVMFKNQTAAKNHSHHGTFIPSHPSIIQAQPSEINASLHHHAHLTISYMHKHSPPHPREKKSNLHASYFPLPNYAEVLALLATSEECLIQCAYGKSSDERPREGGM